MTRPSDLAIKADVYERIALLMAARGREDKRVHWSAEALKTQREQR